MKKLLIALLALSVAGAAYAADPTLKFSGLVDTGVKYVTNAAGEDGLSAYAYDADIPGYRVNLNVVYDAGDYGAKFRLRSQSKETTGTAFFMKWGYAWAKLGGVVLVKGGLVDDAAWQTNGDIGDDVGEGYGVLTQYVGVPGFNAGFGVYTPDSTGASQTKTDVTKYVAGASYKQDGVFAVQGSALFQTAGDKITVAGTDYTPPSQDKSKLQKVLFGLDIYAVPKLTANLELMKSNLAETDYSITTVEQLVKYDLSPIGVSLLCYEWKGGFDDSKLGYKINPGVTYTMDKLVPGFDLVYVKNDGGTEADDASTKITFKPSVAYNVGAGCLVKAFYSYTLNDKTNAYGDDPNTELGIQFTYSF